jgi:type I restriction enzyme, S subunit
MRKSSLSDDWSSVRLSDVAKIVSGGTPSTKNTQFWDGNILWATPTDITKNSKYISSTEQSITNLGLDNCSATLLPIGSVLMTSRATIGPRCINIKPMSTNQGFKSFVCNAELINNEYLYYLIGILEKEFYRLSYGSTFLELSKNSIENFVISLPPLKEQKKIANILSTWDRAIELKQIELNNRITYKENITKKLIIEQAENTKDFDKIKLVTYLKSKYERVGNRDIEPVAVGVFGIRRRSEIFNKELSVDLSNNKVIKQNDLCFGIGTNRIVYDVLFEDSTYCVSPAYGVYEIINCNPYYLKAYLDTYNSYFSRKYMIISARQGKSIEINGLMNEKIAFPALSIQNQIANYLKSIDVYNTKLQLLIEELQIQKKGLMQQLLTGKIRVQT